MNEKMIKKMNEGHPEPWAIYEADPALIKRAEEDADFLWEVMSVFRREMDTDGDGFMEFEKLFRSYCRANEDYRMMIDAVFVHLCGWSLPTIMRMAAGIEDEDATEPAPGDRIKLIHMDDQYAPPDGTEGTVTHIDDIGTIHVNWDTGSTLGLVPNVDKFDILSKEVRS